MPHCFIVKHPSYHTTCVTIDLDVYFFYCDICWYWCAVDIIFEKGENVWETFYSNAHTVYVNVKVTFPATSFIIPGQRLASINS